MAIADKLKIIAENEQKVYDKGYIEGSALKDNKPYINSSEITDFRFFFRENARLSIADKVDFSKGTLFNMAFYNSTQLQTIPASWDFSKGTNFMQAFLGCTGLHTVEYIDFSSVPHATGTAGTTGTFSQCSALVEIRIKENCLKAPINFGYSSLLSDESVQSIIDSLAQWNGTPAKKLTLHADVYAKLTDAQKETIGSKGWEVVSA